MNFLAGERVGRHDRHRRSRDAAGAAASRARSSDPAILAVRPETARLLGEAESPADGEAMATGMVEGSVFVGSQAHAHCLLDGGEGPFVVTRPRIDDAPDAGVRVRVGLARRRVAGLPAASVRAGGRGRRRGAQ